MAQYWDARRVLKLYPTRDTERDCIGIAKHGGRCGLKVPPADRGDADAMLEDLGTMRFDDPELDNILREIAFLTLCRRWHRWEHDPRNGQIGEVVGRWKEKIRKAALRQSSQQVRRTYQAAERANAAAAPSVARAAPNRTEAAQAASSSLASARTQPRPIQAPTPPLPISPRVAVPVPAQLPTPPQTPETPRNTPPREAAAAAALRRHDQTPTRSSRHASDLSSGTTEHRLERMALPTPPPESSEARSVAANRRAQQAVAVTEVESQPRAQRPEPTTPTRSHLPSPPASPLAVESSPIVFGARSLPSAPTHQFTFSTSNNITEPLSADAHTEHTATPEVPTTPQRRTCTRSHRATRRSIPADCAICHDPLTDSQSIVWCKAQCGKNLHRDCWDTWVGSLTPPRGHSRPRNLRCVWCRSTWDSEACPCDDEAPPVEPPTPGEMGIAYLDLHDLPRFISEHLSRLALARLSGSSSSSPIRVETGVGERSGEVTLTLSL